MQQKKSNNIIVYFFLLILVSSINTVSVDNLELNKVKNINIFGLEQIHKNPLLDNLHKLELENIFFLNKIKIQNVLDDNPLIDIYSVKKIYPNGLNINVKKTYFIAKIKKNEKFLYVGNNGKLSDVNLSDYELPYIFGIPKISEFLKFKKIVDQSNFEYSQIKFLYYFKSNRWDLELKNNILIKLPEQVTKEDLDKILIFFENIDLKDKKVVDARIKNQIIVLNGKEN